MGADERRRRKSANRSKRFPARLSRLSGRRRAARYRRGISGLFQKSADLRRGVELAGSALVEIFRFRQLFESIGDWRRAGDRRPFSGRRRLERADQHGAIRRDAGSAQHIASAHADANDQADVDCAQWRIWQRLARGIGRDGYQHTVLIAAIWTGNYRESELRSRPRGAEFFVGSGGRMGSVSKRAALGGAANSERKSDRSRQRARFCQLVFGDGGRDPAKRHRTAACVILEYTGAMQVAPFPVVQTFYRDRKNASRCAAIL